MEAQWTSVHKYLGRFFHYPRTSSPFNVIAWHGNLVPFLYDLNKFVPVGSVRIDHLDPSIFTVLTCPTSEPGTAAADFVIFPPRWAVQERTFRPPWYHRNTMSEFMGNVYGRYEARPDGFLPGGATLHLCMVGHGPDSDTFEKVGALHCTATTSSSASPPRVSCARLTVSAPLCALRCEGHGRCAARRASDARRLAGLHVRDRLHVQSHSVQPRGASARPQLHAVLGRTQEAL